jgi:hypothetical protein
VIAFEGSKELRHGKVFRHKQKVERAIQAGDVAVNADAESRNDFAHG